MHKEVKATRTHLMCVFFFLMSYYHFYWYVGFNQTVLKLVYFLMLVSSFFYVMPVFTTHYRFSAFKILTMLILVMMLLSSIPSYFFWGQEFLLSFRATAPFMGIILYWILLRSGISIGQLMRLTFILVSIYVILWIYALIKAPEMVFVRNGMDDEIFTERGFFRFYIKSADLIPFCFFYFLNKWVVEKRVKWIVLALLLWIFIVFHVTRQTIILSLLVGVLYLYMSRALNKKIFFYFGLLFFTIFLFLKTDSYQQSPITSLIELSSEQVGNGIKEDTRYREMIYFFNDYSPNVICDILGNGVPHESQESPYGRFIMNELAGRKEFWLSDVGYASIYCQFGAVALVLFLLIFYKSQITRLPSNYCFAKYFLLYWFLVNIFSSQVLNMTAFCMSLYIITKIYENTLSVNSRF